MLEVLHFIFSGFWVYLGCVILIAAAAPRINITINRKD